MIRYRYLETPVGPVMLVKDGEALKGLYWQSYRGIPAPGLDWQEDAAAFDDVCRQLDEYFAGSRNTFELELQATGTPFQRRVWEELTTIPQGETRPYQQIATAIGAPQAVRAVGAAIGRNPLSIIVPCHRVIASNGKLTGFAGGIDSKRMLLEHEGVLLIHSKSA